MGNNDVLRGCEAKWLDPDCDDYINAYSGGIDSDGCEVAICEFHDGYVYADDIINVGGFKICVDCAEEIVEAWEKKMGEV